jgi:hypothetical protein
MSLQKIDPPKITNTLASISIEEVEVEGCKQPVVILKNEAKLPTEKVIQMLTDAIMIMVEVQRSQINSN